MNKNVADLSVVQTGCDRIANTPIPFAYSVLLNRTVYFFCFMLPFSLGSLLGLATPLLVGILAYTFLGLDALSTEIEEPFGTQSNDLPLDAMVRSIEIELWGHLVSPHLLQFKLKITTCSKMRLDKTLPNALLVTRWFRVFLI